jgi:hypothetical protein
MGICHNPDLGYPFIIFIGQVCFELNNDFKDTYLPKGVGNHKYLGMKYGIRGV